MTDSGGTISIWTTETPQEDSTFPVLYILVRTDMDSLVPGKAVAQGSHASNAFAHAIQEMDDVPENNDVQLYKKWSTETKQGFGTVLTLAVTEKQMHTAVQVAKQMGIMADLVMDPTYPIRVPRELCEFLSDNMLDREGLEVGTNGRYVTIPAYPTAYVFGDKNDFMLTAVVGNFELLRREDLPEES